MSKNELLLVLFIIVIIIVLSTIFLANKGTGINHISEPSTNIETEEINIDIESYKQDLKNAFSEVEQDYQGTKQYYQRQDYYNRNILSTKSENYIEIVDTGDININSKKYNANLEEIEDFPEIKYNQVNIELSSRYEIDANKYYLIRYQSIENSNYTIYFIGYLRNNGFQDYTVYCVTTGEYFGEE